MTNNRNEYVAQENGLMNPTNVMEQFKNEVAAEIGLYNYDSLDKGALSSRQNGYVGGNMVKKMIAYAQQAMMQQGNQIITNTQSVVEVSPEVRQLNELASKDFQQYTQTIQNNQDLLQ